MMDWLNRQRAEWMVWWARGMLKRKRASEALPILQRAATLAPRYLHAWTNLAWAYIQLKRPQDALESCDRALAIKPRDAWARTNRPLALLGLDRYQEALDAAASAPQRGRLRRVTEQIRLTALYRLDQRDTLLTEAERVARIQPRDMVAWYWLSMALSRQNRHEEALVAAQRATTLGPSFASGWVRASMTLEELGRRNEALAACDHALALDPGLSDALSARVVILDALRRYDEALAASDRAIALPNPSWQTYCNRAFTLLHTARWIEALEPVSLALALAPTQPGPQNEVAVILIHLHYPERALLICERALALKADYLPACANAAAALIDLERYDEARARIARVFRLGDEQRTQVAAATSHANLGIIHTRLGEMIEARRELDIALAAAPEHEDFHVASAEYYLASASHAQALEEVTAAIAAQPAISWHWALKGRILRAAGDAAGAEETEARGAALLAEQRAALVAWEAAHPGWLGAEDAPEMPDAPDAPDAGEASGAG